MVRPGWPGRAIPDGPASAYLDAMSGRKLLVVLGFTLLALVVVTVPALFMDTVGNGYSIVMMLAPFVGSFFGGWWVSRDGSHRLGWILGGGIGIGLLGLLLFLVLVGLALNAVLDDSGGSYCC